MTHFSNAEFVDLLEGQLSSGRAAHLDACAACREQLDGLRLARSRALADDGHEPSPLFWEELPARVAAAVRDERTRPTPWTAWFARPVLTRAALGLLVVAGAFAGARWYGLPGRVTTGPDAIASQVSTAVELRNEMENDEGWSVVRSAAEGLAWEDAHAAGIAARPGSAEMVVLELSADERAELARLLEEDLKRGGA